MSTGKPQFEIYVRLWLKIRAFYFWCETHSTDKSIMFSRAVMEDLDISALLSCTLALLGLGDDPLSALKTRAALENTNKYKLHSLL